MRSFSKKWLYESGDLFPEYEQWNDDLKAIVFPALVNGFQVMCAISGETVANRYGGDDHQQWFELFRAHRWDLEEEVHVLILDQQEDDQGWFWLS